MFKDWSPDIMKKTFYDILGLPENATAEEIKKAYRNLSLVHHPDKGGDEEEFNAILKAYETLIDYDLRAEYDKYGASREKIQNIATAIFKDIMKLNPTNIEESLEDSRIEDIVRIDQSIENLQKESDSLDGIIKRIKEAPSHDFIREALDNEKKVIRINIEQFEENKVLAGSAYEMLKEYSFDVGEEGYTRIRLPSSFTYSARYGEETY
jgi:DnaJ-class molecular chaperone